MTVHVSPECSAHQPGDTPAPLTRVLWCDNAGLTRAKSVTGATWPDTLRNGVGISMGQQALPMMMDAVQPASGLSAVGEVRLVPDPDTLVALPYLPGIAAAIGDMRTLDGQAWGHCPRAFLKRQVAEAARLGFEVMASFENEYYLFRGDEPLDHSTYATLAGFVPAHEVTLDILAALAAQGLTPEMYYPEAGPGQQEISITPARGVSAADRQVLFKATVNAVAVRHGLRASFAAKPVLTGAGSGCHIHLSLWREGRNAFHDSEGELGLSDVARHAIAGVLEHQAGLCALTVPTVNSYRRLEPGWWAGAYACYGLDNREASVRVASTHLLPGASGNSTNFELKTCDGAANPYLALGGLLASALDGVRRRLDPGPPLAVAPGALSDAEREERGIRPLPSSLPDAVAALRGDAVLLEALGPDLTRSFTAVREAEAAYFAQQPEDVELALHRFAY
ncbi:glutamine synthetase family protein [Deinococcus apachensis]|uniref:glutamine synthetase family protein n=1 Tax=Deinococcus apachensis TaxID=309886 RepID=UPI00039A58DF|nr:glutamine synthetase family protein [Deinococcus apachensis]